MEAYMNLTDFIEKTKDASIKMLVGSAAALLGVVALSGALADWPNALVPLTIPMVWFFCAVSLSFASAVVATTASLLPSPPAHWEWPWRYAISALLAASVLVFLLALAKAPFAYAEMTTYLSGPPAQP
jgi:hypothetical protein